MNKAQVKQRLSDWAKGRGKDGATLGRMDNIELRMFKTSELYREMAASIEKPEGPENVVFTDSEYNRVSTNGSPMGFLQYFMIIMICGGMCTCTLRMNSQADKDSAAEICEGEK